MPQNDTPGVHVTLADIYDQVQSTDKKVTQLESSVNELVAVNKRLDDHADELHAHSSRLRAIEAKVSAHTVIVSIVTVGLGALLIRLITT